MSKKKKLSDRLDFSGLVPALASLALLAKEAIVVTNKVIRVKKYQDDTSLIEATKIATVEPLTIVSRDLVSLDYTADITSTALNLFSAYYLQAVDIITKVKDVEVVRILDKLNPNRNEEGWLAMEDTHPSVSMENYKYQLPTTTTISAEAGLDKEDKQELKANSNMAVGKMIDVTIETTGKDENGNDANINVKVPIAIRLLTSIASNDTIKHLLAGKSIDKGIIERYHSWRAGRITFIKDLILCQDLIDEHKKAVMKDESDISGKIMDRVTAAKSYGVITGNPSLAVASNIFIISEQVAKDIEIKLRGKISSASVRNKIFEDSYAMILIIVDREWERVTFYTRGTDLGNEMTIKEVKKSAKGTGPDISDILKSFQLGMSATF